jgi:hypothetical protein
VKETCDYCGSKLVYPCVGLGCPFIEDSECNIFCNDECREAWVAREAAMNPYREQIEQLARDAAIVKREYDASQVAHEAMKSAERSVLMAVYALVGPEYVPTSIPLGSTLRKELEDVVVCLRAKGISKHAEMVAAVVVLLP